MQRLVLYSPGPDPGPTLFPRPEWEEGCLRLRDQAAFLFSEGLSSIKIYMSKNEENRKCLAADSPA